MSRWRLVALTAAFVLSGAGQSQAYGQDQRVLSTIRDGRVEESSALVQSTVDPDLAYTVNDSGHDPTVYVIELASGEVVGSATLSGAEPEDTEALAIGADGRLLVADIGDNYRRRDQVAIYAIPQPGRGEAAPEPAVYPVGYPDGPHDAEALIADPRSGRLWIATKGVLGGALYELPGRLRTDAVNTASAVPGVDVPGLVTDAATWSDGRLVVLRSYSGAFGYALPGWRELGSIVLPRQRQGESITAWAGRSTFLVGTEGLPSPLLQVDLPTAWADLLRGGGGSTPPTAAPAPASPQPAPRAAQSADDDEAVGATAWAVTSGAALVVLGLAWLVVRRGQARRSTT